MKWNIFLSIFLSFTSFGADEADKTSLMRHQILPTSPSIQDLGFDRCVEHAWRSAGSISLISFSHDNKMLATHDPELNVVQVWSFPEMILKFNLFGLPDHIIALGFSATGNELLVNESLKWSMSDGKPIHGELKESPPLMPSAKEDQEQRVIKNFEININKNDDEIVITKLSNSARQSAVLRIPPNPKRYAVSPNQELMAVVDADFTVRFWSLPELIRHSDLLAHAANMAVISISSDGQQLHSVDYRSQAATWLTANQTILNSKVLKFTIDGAFALSATGNYLTSSTVEDETVRLFNLSEEKTVGSLKAGASNQLDLLAINGDASLLISANVDGRFLKLWSMPEGRLMRTMEAGNSLSALAISPDGSMVVGATSGGKMKLWQLPDGMPGLQLSGENKGEISDLTISCDNQRLITTSWMDREIKIWSLADHRVTGVIPWNEELGAPLSMAADDRHLYTVHRHPFLVGSLIAIWDLQTNEFCGVLHK